MSDQERLRAIAEREQQAAAEPWIVEGRTIYALHHNGDYRKGKPVEVNRFYAQIQDMTRQGAQEGEAEATAQFIAHAREDIPYLLSLVAQQAQEIESLRQLISKPVIADRLQQIADLRADYERQAQEIEQWRCQAAEAEDKYIASVRYADTIIEAKNRHLSEVSRQAQEIQDLRTERDTFYMDYRIKSDAQSKAALVRAESAESSRDALREALKKLALKWEEAGAFERVRLGDNGVAMQATYCDCADDLSQLLADSQTEDPLKEV